MADLRNRLFAAELGKGFIEASSPTGRDLQIMLRGRPDIRRLMGFAEEKVMEDVFRRLEGARIMANALADIARGHLSIRQQTDLAMNALAECGRLVEDTTHGR